MLHYHAPETAVVMKDQEPEHTKNIHFMESQKKKKSHFAWMLILHLICLPALAQDKSVPVPLDPGYYIVVGAYLTGQEDYASRFVADVNRAGRHAQFGYDPTRRFYYVYLDYYADFNTAIQKMLQTRKEGGFPRAWVRIMKLPVMSEKVNLLTEKKEIGITAPEEKVLIKKKVEVISAAEVKEPVQPVTAVQTPATAVNTVSTDSVENTKPGLVFHTKTLTDTPVFFRLANPTNHAVVDGEVEVIDTERSKLIKKVKGNDYSILPDPKSKSGKLTIIGSSFGYRKEQHELNYKSTEADTLQSYISLEGNHYIIRFEMIRLHRGDIATLYNVYYYNDAAVMLPESKYELNKLLTMMNENSKYHIRLHGHTNGRANGMLITMGETRNFFELTSDVKKGIGSAKELSRKRAEVIRDWLVANGISNDRMDIKAWGGSRMIHDKNSAHARKNVRVEVEVIED